MPLQYNLIEVSLKELVQICFLYCTYCFYSESLLYPLILHLQINFSDSLSFIFLWACTRDVYVWIWWETYTSAHRAIFFGPTEVSTLRRFMPHHLKQCSTFELLTTCIWRCHTIALYTKPHEVVRVLCIVDARAKFDPPLPTSYYGNVFAFSVAFTTAGKLCENPLVTLWNWWRRRRTT